MEQSKKSSKSVLYFSPSMTLEENIAPLNRYTFVQRLNDLSQAIHALKVLEKQMRKSSH